MTLNDDLANQIKAKVLAKGAVALGGQAGLKMAIGAFTICAQVIVAKKLGPKVAQKVAAKLAVSSQQKPQHDGYRCFLQL